MLLLVSYFLSLIVKRYRAFVYTAIQRKLLLLLLLLLLLTPAILLKDIFEFVFNRTVDQLPTGRASGSSRGKAQSVVQWNLD